jgi:hypothetical protein
MPVKFKIYYACSLYLLLWGCAMTTFLYLTPLKDRLGRPNTAITITMCLLFVILIVKSLLSIKAVHHYKSNTRHSKGGRRLFISTFCLTILVTLIMSATAILMLGNLIKNGEDTDAQGHVYISQLLYHVLYFTATACSIYLCILDLILLKAIRKGYYNPMLNFGKDIIEPT